MNWPIFLTEYASRRIEQRGITLSEVELLLKRPDHRVDAVDSLHSRISKNLGSGRVVTVIADDLGGAWLVITAFVWDE